MEEYFFRKNGLEVSQVKAIVAAAAYDESDYLYEMMADSKDGVIAKDKSDTSPVMSINRLENAAKLLKINNVEVTSPAASISDIEKQFSVGSNYSIDINLSQATVGALSGGSYELYGFKAVKSSQGGGQPVVWFKSNDYSLTTAVKWQVDYQAYTSKSSIIPNGTITAAANYDIAIGQALTVKGSQGTGTVGAGQVGNAISIMNETSDPFTCGISQLVGGSSNPMCAFPLYGNQLDVMAPIEKVLLMFATTQVNTGTVIEKAYSSGVLIDLTAVNNRTVDFDINKGWSWGGFSWAQSVAPSADLSPLLIDK